MKNLIKNLMNKLGLFMLFTGSVFAFDTPTISQQQLLALLNAPSSQDFIILDVRSAEEFNQQHISGAMNISHDTIADHLDTLAAFKNKLVVVHCRSGRRAKAAEEVLINNGFTNIQHLAGDMNGWLEANLPTVKQ